MPSAKNQRSGTVETVEERKRMFDESPQMLLKRPDPLMWLSSHVGVAGVVTPRLLAVTFADPDRTGRLIGRGLCLFRQEVEP